MRKLVLVVAAVICLAGCAQPQAEQAQESEGAMPADLTQLAPEVHDGTYKFCDAGRAVYIMDGVRSGGIAVVDNAPECKVSD